MRAIASWSGGKDACLATHCVQQMGYEIHALLNMAEPEGHTSRAHGLPARVLRRQADALSTKLQLAEASWENYAQVFRHVLQGAKSEGCTHVVFGDIDLQAHRDWEQMVCQEVGLEALWPLWGFDRRELVHLMLNDLKMQVEVVSVQEQLGTQWLGRQMDETLVHEMVAAGVDPSGENGEFHTLVRNAPWFRCRVETAAKGQALRAGHWMLTW